MIGQLSANAETGFASLVLTVDERKSVKSKIKIWDIVLTGGSMTISGSLVEGASNTFSLNHVTEDDFTFEIPGAISRLRIALNGMQSCRFAYIES